MDQASENYSLDQILKRIAWFGLFCTVYGYGVGYYMAKDQVVTAGIVTGILLALMIYLVTRWAKVATNHANGIRGEIKVAAMLAQLAQKNYWYENDIVLPGAKANIDHVVVGATGVWLIETKHWDGKFVRLRNGILEKDGKQIEQKLLSGLRARAKSLNEHLAKKGARVDWIQPVLVFSRDNTSVQVHQPVNGVNVVGFRDLNKLILNESSRTQLTAAQQNNIRTVLKKVEVA